MRNGRPQVRHVVFRADVGVRARFLGLVGIDIRQLHHFLKFLHVAGRADGGAERAGQGQRPVLYGIFAQHLAALFNLFLAVLLPAVHHAQEFVAIIMVSILRPEAVHQGGGKKVHDLLAQLVAVKIIVEGKAVHIRQRHRHIPAHVIFHPGVQGIAVLAVRVRFMLQPVFFLHRMLQHFHADAQKHAHQGDDGNVKFKHMHGVHDPYGTLLAEKAHSQEQRDPYGGNQRHADGLVHNKHRQGDHEQKHGNGLPLRVQHRAQQNGHQHGRGFQKIQ